MRETGVPLSMNDVKHISLHILKRVTDICDELNLRYVLAFGTLLGAVRHRGFIPWDDDIDIMMYRKDYEALIHYFYSKGNDIENLECFVPGDHSGYHYNIVRICDKSTIIHSKFEKDCGMGIFIDIYPLDELGKDYDNALKLMQHTQKTVGELQLSASKFSLKNSSALKDKVKYILRYSYCRVLGQRYFSNKTNNFIRCHCIFNDSSYLGVAAWNFNPLINIFPRDIIENRVKLKFEEYEFFVPKNYDGILRITYNDYMQLPPENERIAHHYYSAYRRKL